MIGLDRPRVASVLTARPWETDLVRLARRTGLVRLVHRAYEPDDIERRRAELDAVVAGAETAWINPARLLAWSRWGLPVLGIYPTGDEPARRLLSRGGVAEQLPDSAPTERMLMTARLLGTEAHRPAGSGTVISVTGPRGAPGRSEVALGLAWTLGAENRTALLDLDVEAPTMAIRLGLRPRPDLVAAAEAVHRSGHLPEAMLGQVGPLAVLVGPLPGAATDVPAAMLNEVLYAAPARFDMVVVDSGPPTRQAPRNGADAVVLVCDASPRGLVRGAELARTWTGEPPALVLNRTPPTERIEVIRSCRHWIGLEPDAVVPLDPEVDRAARLGGEPHPRLLEALRPLAARLTKRDSTRETGSGG